MTKESSPTNALTEDQLQSILQSELPSPSAEAKTQAVKAAMAAFEQQNEQTSKNNLEQGQGNERGLRLTSVLSIFRSLEMALKRNQMILGGLGSACVLLLGVFLFHDVQDAAAPLVSEWDADLSEPVLSQQAQQQAEQRASQQKSEGEASGGKGQVHALADEADLSITAPAPESPMPRAKIKVAEHEEVVVKGIRAQASQARDLKRQASTVVDSIAASNIASLESKSRQMPMALAAEPEVGMPVPSADRDRFSKTEENSIKRVTQEPVSTFSIDVDTASYSYVRAQLNSGVLPQKDAVRVEELINYFDYQYPLPKDKAQPFRPSVVVSDSPWNPGKQLLHIGIKGYDLVADHKPDSNLVFLLDVSGSMNSADKLPLVKQSMGLLLDNLKPTDTVAIVVYAGAAGMVLEPTPAKDKSKILQALNRLQAGGSTAGAAGIALAYELAEQNYKKDAVNRVILATDGDFNVGVTQDERLQDFVERKRASGIYLSVLGFGRGNYQDAMMQTLAQNGNGVAAYIDTLSEAQKVLVHQANSNLFPIAEDVKIQLEFNPATVAEYRLVGYETRALKTEDFNNDKVDAGEIGAGHSVTAIYEITPVGGNTMVDESRYQGLKSEQNAVSTELGFLKIRYKLPGEKQSKLITRAIESPNKKELNADAAALQQEVDFASAVAGFAQLLKGGRYLSDYSYQQVVEAAQANKGSDEFGYRTEFIQLVRKAKLAKAL